MTSSTRNCPASYRADEEQVIQSGESLVDHEELYLDHNHNQKWFLTTKVPLRDHHGVITGIIGINHDIYRTQTSRRRIGKCQMTLEAALSRRPFHGAGSMPDAVLRIVNTACLEFLDING